MPRTSRSIFTPAWDARYSARITSGSTSAFILATMRPSLPKPRSRSISSMIRSFSPTGATANRRQAGGDE